MGNFKIHKKRNAGFTLTEIVVVMVLLGLIIVLATSITLIVNRSQKISQLDSKDQSEILKLETAFNDWLMLYDSSYYSIEVADHKIEIINILDFDEKQTVFMEFTSDNTSTLTYYEDVDGFSVSKTSIDFSSISDITFDICDKNIIRCTASFRSTDYKYKILYYMRVAPLQEK